MMTDRDLDRQLGVWFEGRATSTPPDDLLERSLVRVRTIRQRPGWIVRDRWLSGDRWALPASRPARLGLAVAGLLVIVIIATAAGGLFRRIPALLVEPSPSPSPIATPSPSQIDAIPGPSLRSTPTPNAAFPVTTGMFARLSDFLLASETVGWAAIDTRLYRTADLGRTWTQMRPLRSPSTAAHAFVDADTMYAASGGSPATIAATHDGGATWIEVRLDVGAVSGGPVFSFETPLRGFATFYDPNDTNPLRVYATTDGGVTWTRPTTGNVPHPASSFVKVNGPVGGFLYQSSGKADNKPFDNRFFLSADGGASWTQYTFPIGTRSPKDALKNIRAIEREDDGRFLLAIDVDGASQRVYESGDDPASWRLVKELPATFGVQFLSPTEWVITSDNALSEIRTTADQGEHWRTTIARTSTYYFDAFQFASPETGWATVQCRFLAGASCGPARHEQVLMVTTDGGATWTRIDE